MEVKERKLEISSADCWYFVFRTSSEISTVIVVSRFAESDSIEALYTQFKQFLMQSLEKKMINKNITLLSAIRRLRSS